MSSFISSPNQKPILTSHFTFQGDEQDQQQRLSELISQSKLLLSLAQGFELQLPGLKHLQSIYLPKLEQMVAEKNMVATSSSSQWIIPCT